LRLWEEFCSLWPDKIDKKDIYFTKYPGHAKEIAASLKDCEIIAVAGGDGAVSNALTGIMQRAIPHPKLAIIPVGTGNDIARTIGICSIDDAVKTLRRADHRSFDLIRIECERDGAHVGKYAFLYCNIGFSTVCHRMLKPWIKRLFGAQGAYFLIAFLGIFIYKPPMMTVRFNDQERVGRKWMVLVGNAEYSAGGTMRLAPGASTSDGKLNALLMPVLSRLKILRSLSKVSKGAHINDPGVEYFPVQNIEIESEAFAGVEIDGDIFGNTPAKMSICPNAIEFIS